MYNNKRSAVLALLILAVGIFGVTTGFCVDDDITTVGTAVSGYVTMAKAIGVGILLFVVGRSIFKRLARG